MFEAIGGRKFIFGILTMLVGAALATFGKGLDATAASFLVGLYTAFSAANALTTIKTLGAGESEPTAGSQQPTPTSPVIEQALNHLIAGQASTVEATQTNQATLASIQKTLIALLQTKG